MPGWQYAGEGRRPVCMAAIAMGSPVSESAKEHDRQAYRECG
jgi:hypothetical protein